MFDLAAYHLQIDQPGRQNYGQDDQHGNHHQNPDQPFSEYFAFAHSAALISKEWLKPEWANSYLVVYNGGSNMSNNIIAKEKFEGAWRILSATIDDDLVMEI